MSRAKMSEKNGDHQKNGKNMMEMHVRERERATKKPLAVRDEEMSTICSTYISFGSAQWTNLKCN